MSAMLDIQKKNLQDLKGKTDKMKQLLPIVGAALVVILVLCLLAVPFAKYQTKSYKGIETTKVTFGDLSDLSDAQREKYSLGNVNTFRVFLWIATVGVGALVVKGYLDREKGGIPYKYSLIAGGVLFVVILLVMISHLNAETEMFYGNSTSSLWWFLPMLVDALYMGLVAALMTFEKVIGQVETNTAALEAEEAQKETTEE